MGKKPPPFVGKKRGKNGTLSYIGIFALLAGVLYVGATFFFNKRFAPTPSGRPTRENSGRRAQEEQDGAPERRSPKKRQEAPARKKKPTKNDVGSDGSKYDHEWESLPRDMDACLASQQELMTIPVEWPGFHALCIESVSTTLPLSMVNVLLHETSGKSDVQGTRNLRAWDNQQTEADHPVLETLIAQLQDELLPHEFKEVDRMISTSAYDFPPNPWRLFTQRGHQVTSDADLATLGRGAALWLYTGGQFIWPGVRLGHTYEVPIPIQSADGTPGGHKIVSLTTRSLRPVVLELSGFLSEDECDFIKRYASSRMVPSGVATMDSSRDVADVRTSTQTFMERNGSPQIRALEERAHNLTRLPYSLGENIQVVRYEVGQKYGAHRDFFNPNDYHRQPAMLRSVEYGARNRLATVFWYLANVAEGGETFFPRALNEAGREYHPWNGDHENCYRGLSVPPIRGNAVLFYSMVPDGRLDERSLHGGCKPRNGGEKWGANQWIWNHPNRHSGVAPRKGQAGQPSKPRKGRPGCMDLDENCEAWAEGGECDRNPEFMKSSCKASCRAC